MELGCDRGMMANEQIAVGSNSYEKVKTIKYLGSLMRNHNSVHKEIKCLHLKRENLVIVQFKHFCLLFKNLKIKIK